MKLISKASSSHGNCHILLGKKEALMLDCGITNLAFASKYNLVGVLLSHTHKDHVLGLTKSNFLGNVKIYGGKSTLDECVGVMPFLKHDVSVSNRIFIGDEWVIKPFLVPHDRTNYAYLIYHKISRKKILYITDVGCLDEYAFDDINTYIIECNYDEDYYKQIDDASYTRILTSEEQSELAKYRRLSSGNGHLSIQQCIEFLKRDLNNNTKNIILIHISSTLKNYKKVQERVASELPNNVKVVAINNKIAPSKEQVTIL